MSKSSLLLSEILQHQQKKYIILAIISLLGSLYIFVTSAKTTVYEIGLELTNTIPFSLVFLPCYMILLIIYFSSDMLQNYDFLYRFVSRKQWYRQLVLQLTQMTMFFLLLWMLYLVLYALFTVDFLPQWSELQELQPFAEEMSPILYSLLSMLLVWFGLLAVGLTFLVGWLATGKLYLSYLISLVILSFQVVVMVGQVRKLEPYTLITLFSPMKFQLAYQLDVDVFPLSIFIVWSVILPILYGLGAILAQRKDFDFEKGERYEK